MRTSLRAFPPPHIEDFRNIRIWETLEAHCRGRRSLKNSYTRLQDEEEEEEKNTILQTRIQHIGIIGTEMYSVECQRVE